jgi:hypothetical protein
MVEGLDRGDDEETSSRSRVAARSCAVPGADALTGHHGVDEASKFTRVGKRGPVARRANRRGQAAQRCSALVVPKLVAAPITSARSIPRLPRKKDKFPSRRSLSTLKGYKPKAQHERFWNFANLSLLSSAFGKTTVLVPTSRIIA